MARHTPKQKHEHKVNHNLVSQAPLVEAAHEAASALRLLLRRDIGALTAEREAAVKERDAVPTIGRSNDGRYGALVRRIASIDAGLVEARADFAKAGAREKELQAFVWGEAIARALMEGNKQGHVTHRSQIEHFCVAGVLIAQEIASRPGGASRRALAVAKFVELATADKDVEMGGTRFYGAYATATTEQMKAAVTTAWTQSQPAPQAPPEPPAPAPDAPTEGTPDEGDLRS